MLMKKANPAQDFINVAVITDPTEQTAIGNLKSDLINSGLWDKMWVIFPFIGGTSLSHSINLKDPRNLDVARRMRWFGGITHDSNGVKGNGIDGYGEFNLKPSQEGLFPNNSHLSYYTRDNFLEANTPARASFGNAFSNTNCMYLIVNRTSLVATSNIGADANLANYNPGVAIKGFVVGSRVSSTSNKIYLNGSLKTTTTTANTFNETYNLNSKIFSGGETTPVYSAIGSSFASMGTGLTDSEQLIFNNIVTVYQTALSRNV